MNPTYTIIIILAGLYLLYNLYGLIGLSFVSKKIEKIEESENINFQFDTVTNLEVELQQLKIEVKSQNRKSREFNHYGKLLKRFSFIVFQKKLKRVKELYNSKSSSLEHIELISYLNSRFDEFIHKKIQRFNENIQDTVFNGGPTDKYENLLEMKLTKIDKLISSCNDFRNVVNRRLINPFSSKKKEFDTRIDRKISQIRDQKILIEKNFKSSMKLYENAKIKELSKKFQELDHFSKKITDNPTAYDLNEFVPLMEEEKLNLPTNIRILIGNKFLNRYKHKLKTLNKYKEELLELENVKTILKQLRITESVISKFNTKISYYDLASLSEIIKKCEAQVITLITYTKHITPGNKVNDQIEDFVGTLLNKVSYLDEKFKKFRSQMKIPKLEIVKKMDFDSLLRNLEINPEDFVKMDYQEGIQLILKNGINKDITLQEFENELFSIDQQLKNKRDLYMYLSFIIRYNDRLRYLILLRVIIDIYFEENTITNSTGNLLDYSHSFKTETVEPIGLYFDIIRENSNEIVDNEKVETIISYYKKNESQYDIEFVLLILFNLYEMIGYSNLKFTYNILNTIVEKSKGQEFYEEIVLLEIDYLFDLGRFDEALRLIESVEPEKLPKSELKTSYIIFYSNIWDAKGNEQKAIETIDRSLAIEQANKTRLVHELLRLNVKYHNWERILNMKKQYRDEFDERYDIAKELTNIENESNLVIEKMLTESETKLNIVTRLIHSERHHYIPNLTNEIQNQLLTFGEFPNNRKLSNLLGYAYYYEGLSYELLLDEIDKLDDCYSMAEYYFENAKNIPPLIEVKIKLLELKQLNILGLQTKLSRDQDIMENPSKIMETLAMVKNIENKEITPLIEDIVTNKNKINDSILQEKINVIDSDFDRWSNNIKQKYNLFLFSTNYDKYRLFDFLKILNININNQARRDVEIIIALLRRLRPGRKTKFFNFSEIIKEIRKIRLNNMVLNRINKYELLNKVFTLKSAYTNKYSNFSLIEATSLLFILSLPFIVNNEKSIREISLSYQTIFNKLLKSYSFDKLTQAFDDSSFAFKVCLIETAPILNAFGGKEYGK